MTRISLRSAFVIACLALSLLACQGGFPLAMQDVRPLPGMQAPDFSLKSTGGKNITLSQYRGQPVLLILFELKCGLCRDQMSAVQAVYKKYRKQGLAVIAVDYYDSTQKIKTFRQDHGLTYPIVLDKDQAVIHLYQPDDIPANYFIDADGVIHTMIMGAMEAGDIEDAVKELLADSKTEVHP